VPDKEVVKPDEPEYVTGFKLAIIVASVALACFLMLLDTMIISTVCLAKPHHELSRRLHGILVCFPCRQFHASQIPSTLSQMLDGMPARTSLAGKVLNISSFKKVVD
jgi:hypothetical protein